MSKFVMVKFPPPELCSRINTYADTERACKELQAQLVWSLPKGTTISICDEATIPCAVISSEQAKGQ